LIYEVDRIGISVCFASGDLRHWSRQYVNREGLGKGMLKEDLTSLVI